MSRIEEIKAKCENVITAGLLDGEPYDDVKEYIEALESALAESQRELFNMSYVKALAAESTAELEKYRAAEQGGQLVVLPCKVGDTVYEPRPDRNLISSYKITQIRIHEYGRIYADWQCIEGIYSNLNCFALSALGKTVFLTREAAKQVLAERKERDPQ